MMDLPKELLEEVENKYHAFVSSAREKKIDLPLDNELIKNLKKVFILSDFISKNIIKNPSILVDILKDIRETYNKNTYAAKLNKILENEEDKLELAKKLRFIRTKEMIRIAWRDLLEIGNIHEIMYELSCFADVCINKSIEIFYSLYSKKFGIPIGFKSKCPQKLVVIALGKLGGKELNFSSDIDIMFAYPETGFTKHRSISNDEFFSYICRNIIAILSEYTSEGFVFRVDTRLRPFGKSGPIVMNFDAIEEYYQIHGREWERYALIKARIAAGDKNEGEKLLNRLNPFVYRKYLDFTTFESLREMKLRIMSEIKHTSILDDIKMGPGGIREIEFFVQVFQLIRGGIDQELQTPHLLNAINILKTKSYLPANVCDTLLEAYIFLRKLENRLQEYNDLQTHKLPKFHIDRLRLAISMGFSNWKKFYECLMDYTSSVHLYFDQLLAPRDKKTEKKDVFFFAWETEDNNIRKKTLISAGIDKAEEISNIIADFKDSPLTRNLGAKGRNFLSKLFPIILKKALYKKDPIIVLNRLIELIKKIQSRTNYLSLMVENPQVIDHLMKFAEESSWIISFVAKNPALLDELIDPRNLYTPPTRNELEQEMQNRLNNINPDDLESQMIQMCLFRQTNTLRVAAADITGAISVTEVSTYLTEIAEVLLDATMKLAWSHSLKKLKIKNISVGTGFCIIGYGKLGGRELGYNSDLDIVFLHAGDKNDFYIKVAQNIIYILTTYTMMGKAYEVDTRLRPDGSSGILAVSINAFREYQEERAWTWEHQALLRARPICGDKNLMNEFLKTRYTVLSRKRDKNKLLKEILDMRNKIITQLSKKIPEFFHLKYDPGGIIDIEFFIQYMVLLNAHLYPELLKWTSHIHFLNELIRLNLIEKKEAEFLKNAYLEIRYTIHRLSLQESSLLVKDKKINEIKNKIIHFWKKINS